MMVANRSLSGRLKKSILRAPGGQCAGSISIAVQPGMREENAPSPAAGSSTRPEFLRSASRRSTIAGGVNTCPKAATFLRLWPGMSGSAEAASAWIPACAGMTWTGRVPAGAAVLFTCDQNVPITHIGTRRPEPLAASWRTQLPSPRSSIK